LGVEFDSLRDDAIDEDCQYIGSEDFSKIYLKTCEIGDPTFKYSVMSSDTNKVYIGGYGVFGP
jgi:hypothetical protein